MTLELATFGQVRLIFGESAETGVSLNSSTLDVPESFCDMALSKAAFLGMYTLEQRLLPVRYFHASKFGHYLRLVASALRSLVPGSRYESIRLTDA